MVEEAIVITDGRWWFNCGKKRSQRQQVQWFGFHRVCQMGFTIKRRLQLVRSARRELLILVLGRFHLL